MTFFLECFEERGDFWVFREWGLDYVYDVVSDDGDFVCGYFQFVFYNYAVSSLGAVRLWCFYEYASNGRVMEASSCDP